MKQTRSLMGMTVSVEIVDPQASEDDINAVYDYFHYIDEKFSTYKETSEITKINKGLIPENQFSQDMQTVFKLCAETKRLTDGYFNIALSGKVVDPSGLVKGWAINNAAEILKKRRLKNYYIDAGGDIQVSGMNTEGHPWKIGIKNPFNTKEIVKVVYLKNNEGIATSGTYERGNHIYDPHDKKKKITDIVSLTVIGKNIYEADRFATAAFAMGEPGIQFIENLNGFEGYIIDNKGIATFTNGFEKYTYV